MDSLIGKWKKTSEDCYFCSQTNQGNVCRKCRNIFKHMHKGTDEEYARYTDCSNCDFYGFPCMNCAKYVFDGRFGLGCPKDVLKTKQELLDVLDGKESCDKESDSVLGKDSDSCNKEESCKEESCNKEESDPKDDGCTIS